MDIKLLDLTEYIQELLESTKGEYYITRSDRVRAGEPEPVGAGCFWLLGAGAGAA